MKLKPLLLATTAILLATVTLAGTWTYNADTGTLAHDDTGWVLTVTPEGTCLTVTGIGAPPLTPSPLPLADTITGGYSVTTIGYGAFRGCHRLETDQRTDSL